MWFMWTLIVLYALDAIARVILVGEKREPLIKGNAVFSLIWNAAVIFGLLHYWGK